MEKLTGKQLENMEFDEMGLSDPTFEKVIGNEKAHLERITSWMDALVEIAADARTKGIDKFEDINWNGLVYITKELHDTMLSARFLAEDLKRKHQETEHKATR